MMFHKVRDGFKNKDNGFWSTNAQGEHGPALQVYLGSPTRDSRFVFWSEEDHHNTLPNNWIWT